MRTPLEMLCSHPSGCSDMCLLRGALLHFVSGVTLPVFFGFVSGVRTRGVKCERNFKKNVSPLSRTWFVGVPISKVGGWCFLCVRALLVVSFGLLVVAIRGNARKFCSWKNVSPLPARRCLMGLSNDGCRGFGKKKRLPPFWHPSFDSFELLFCRRFFGSYNL